MKKYEIIKVWYNGLNTNIKVISNEYNTFDEANIDRIYFQPDYLEKLEVRTLDISK